VARLGIVSRDGVFVNLKNFEVFVSLLHGQSHLVNESRTCQRPLGDRLVRLFAIGVGVCGARLAFGEQQLVVAPIT